MLATAPKSTLSYYNRPRLTVPISGMLASIPKTFAILLALVLRKSIFLAALLIIISMIETNALPIPKKIFLVVLLSCTKLYRAFFAPAFAAALIKSKVLAATCSIPTKPPWLVLKKPANAPVLPFVVSPTLQAYYQQRQIQHPKPLKTHHRQTR